MLPVLCLMLAPDRFDQRAADWRNGAVVYQVFVDRFVPPDDPKAKQSLYPTPLHSWTETPQGSGYDPAIKGYPHVFQFWGGDLKGLRTKLDYVRGLGADVLYLQPIFKSPSNHKYDATDYRTIDPQVGTESDLKALVGDLHARDMRLVLDGVFNHVGDTSPLFHDPAKRDWFVFDSKLPNGYRAWMDVASLPTWRLESPAVQDYLWQGRDSVVRHYLRLGIDGWRLDVAYEIGPNLLASLTRAAHAAKPGSLVVGEIAGYPAGWSDAVDGVFDPMPLALGAALTHGTMTGAQAGQTLTHLVKDAGMESLLKSWLLVENHDRPRLASLLPNAADRRIVTALQMTLPGAPCVYYGEELGMTGAGDPTNRAPMRWDLAQEANPDYAWMRSLLALRKSRRELRIGDFAALDTNRLLAYVRSTDKLKETTLVAINPTDETVTESVATRVGRLLSWNELEDLLTHRRVQAVNGLVQLTLPPRSVAIFAPVLNKTGGYSPYERIP